MLSLMKRELKISNLHVIRRVLGHLLNLFRAKGDCTKGVRPPLELGVVVKVLLQHLQTACMFVLGVLVQHRHLK